MQRFKEKVFGNMLKDDGGSFVMHTEVLEMMQSSVKYVMDHKNEILAGDGDFGELKPLLEMVIGKGNS